MLLSSEPTYTAPFATAGEEKMLYPVAALQLKSSSPRWTDRARLRLR